MAELNKIVKLTAAQYAILENGGTVGEYTGLNSNYLYLVEDSTSPVLTVNNVSPDSNGNVSLTIPTVSLTTTTGSEAITVDSSSLNVVTRDTAQTIEATKTFNNDSSIIFTYTNSAIPTYGGIKSKYLTEYTILKPTYVQQGYGGYMVTDLSAYPGDDNSFIRFNSSVQPASNNTLNLGNSSQKFAHIYGVNLHGTDLLLSGVMKNGSGNYGISIPTTTSYTANKTIATTSDLSNLVSASASGNTLTLTPYGGGTAITYTPSFTDTNYYAKTINTTGLKIATGYTGSTASSTYDLYVPTGTSSTTVALGDHTHSLVIRNSGDTADVTSLSANTTYILKAGGSSYTFKTPVDNNTTTYLSYTSTPTTDTSKTNYLVGKQSVSTTSTNYYNSNVYFKAGSLFATDYTVGGTAKISYDSTNECLKFTF